MHPLQQALDMVVLTQADENEGPIAAHPLAIAPHDLEIGADMRSEVDLVDHQQIAAGDAWASLARDLVALSNVDDIDRAVGKLRRKGRGEIVAARLDDDDFEAGELRFEVADGAQVDAGVFTDGAVRTAAGFDADDA